MNNLNSKICMAHRSGKLIFGFNLVKDAILKRKVTLVIVCSDVSKKTRKEIAFFSDKFGVTVLDISLSIDELHFVLGKKAGIVGVNDKYYALSLIENANLDTKS